MKNINWGKRMMIIRFLLLVISWIVPTILWIVHTYNYREELDVCGKNADCMMNDMPDGYYQEQERNNSIEEVLGGGVFLLTILIPLRIYIWYKYNKSHKE